MKIGKHTLKIGDWFTVTYPIQNDINHNTYDVQIRRIFDDEEIIAGDLYCSDGSHELVVLEIRANAILDITDAQPSVISKIKVGRKTPKYPALTQSSALASKNAARAIAHGFYYGEDDPLATVIDDDVVLA